MRKVLIGAAAIIGLILVGLGAWRIFGGGSDAAYEQLKASGTLTGPARDQFMADFIIGCDRKRPDAVSADAFKQFCTCSADKVADLITPAEAEAIKQTNAMPDSLLAKLKEPIKQCLQGAGLTPAQ
jgi:hypothetical protein